MTNPAASVVYVLPDTLGGVIGIVRNLLEHRSDDGLMYQAVLTRNLCDERELSRETLRVDNLRRFEYALPVENLRSVLRRLWATVPAGRGVLVANDLLELAMLHVHDPGRTVVHMLHGDIDYYYGLAVRHEAVIDVFVAYSTAMFAGLRQRLPHRVDDIRHLPYGVPVPRPRRQASSGPLRLLYAGRIEHRQKGIFDLPLIDAALHERGISVMWTIIGDGPDAAALRERWQRPHVQFLGALSHAEALDRAADHDVFVLPTRFEGLPVALLEAMGAGLTCVVSDIASGVRDAVSSGDTGLLAPVGNIDAFADAIASLDANRSRLETIGAAAREKVLTDFDIEDRARAYQRLFADWSTLRRPRTTVPPLPYGSRLDQRWIPNRVVRVVRSTLRRGVKAKVQ